jgi:actin-related protein 8
MHTLARRDELTSSKSGALPEKQARGDIAGKIEGVRSDLKTIMRNLKLRGLGNGRQQAANYNANVTAEVVAEHNDMFAVDWTTSTTVLGNVLIGERAERLDCFSSDHIQGRSSQAWKLFYPFVGGHFNTDSYVDHYGTSSALQALLNDIKAIWSHAITSPREEEADRQEAGQIVDVGLGIPAKDWSKYNVILVIPDLYILSEVEKLVGLLLEDMGFAGILIQQEGVSATFGAGLSSSCVVHLGGDRTTISCVEEGLTITESRMALNYGGHDVSRFFLQLLEKANFPYETFNIDRKLADYWLAEQLKEKLCTLDASQLGLIISDFHLRLPKQKTKKYTLRTYDEIIIAPMALFTPKVFSIETKRLRFVSKAPTASTQQANNPILGPDDDAEEVDGSSNQGGVILPTTAAMTLCVRHLLPAPPPPAAAAAVPTTDSTAQAAPAAASAPASVKPEAIALEPISLSEVRKQASRQGTPGNMTPVVKDDENSMASSARTSPIARNGNAKTAGAAASTDPSTSISTIDVPWEASKVPLDFAVWNSIQASISNLGSAGTSEERIRRMTSNIICTGGTALIPGIGFALEARLNNYLFQWYTNQGKDPHSSNAPSATVVPPPRDMDPRILAWKGMSVLARLDSTQEMWIPRKDWQMFGSRALKEKSLFL